MYSPRTSTTTQYLLLQRIFASILQLSTVLKLLFAMGIVVILVYGDMQGWAFTKHFRLKIMDSTTSVWSITHGATHWIQEKIQHIQHHFSVHEENLHLKNQLEQVTHWRNVANQLAAENDHLRKFLNVSTLSTYPTITARVITNPYTPSNQTIIIDAGSNQGVAKYQPVIVPNGVVGRIIEVGNNSARVLLTTDPRSRIPVQGESSKFQAIVAGNQANSLKITHHEAHKSDLSSQRLLTSGKGKVFPEGLMVASMKAVAPENQTLIIEPAVTWRDLDYVQVIGSSENTPHD